MMWRTSWCLLSNTHSSMGDTFCFLNNNSCNVVAVWQMCTTCRDLKCNRYREHLPISLTNHVVMELIHAFV